MPKTRIRFTKQAKRVFGYLFLAAVFAALAFAPHFISALAFFFPIPLFRLAAKTPKINMLRKSIGYGFLLGLFIDILAYHWLIHTMMVFGHLPWYGSIFFFVAYAFITSFRFMIFFLLLFLRPFFRRKLATKNRNLKWLLTLTTFPIYVTFAWVLAEWLGWQLFPWHFGDLAGGNLVFIQFADIFGIEGVSAILMLCSAWLYGLFLYFIRLQNASLFFKIQRLSRTPAFVFLFITLIVTHLYGFFQYERWEQKSNEARKFTALVPQPNAPLAFSHLKTYAQYQSMMQNLVDTVVEQTRQLYYDAVLAGVYPDIIVWPESAVPFQSYETSLYFRSRVQELLQETNIPILLNDVSKEKGKAFSAMSFVNPDGQVAAKYYKIYLLPFGEMIPLGDKFPKLYEWFPEISDFSSGNAYVLFPSKEYFLLPVICYEVIQSEFIREFFSDTQKKANVLINITNDRWFGKSIESYQHLQLARIRAIELRRSLIRATNSGVSAMVYPSGKQMGLTPLFEKAKRIYTVPLIEKENTFFSVWGAWPLRLISFLYFLLLALLSIGIRDMVKRRISE
ncbi:MAG: apolipoprotein N-acyltransferase [Candidatus Hydrogenedentota bacterium]|nr:MAG: apolipoprotein N-acyltransferase [Candidatus Hydrogenedentota bacterium]